MKIIKFLFLAMMINIVLSSCTTTEQTKEELETLHQLTKAEEEGEEENPNPVDVADPTDDDADNPADDPDEN